MKPTYGDVTAEYRMLRESAARVTGVHDLLWVEGPDAVGFLQGILSQDVESMAPGTVARSFFLSPQGKLQALLWLLRGEERVGVVTDAGFGETVADGLGHYRIRVKAEIRLDDRPIAEAWGPEARVAVPVEASRWTESDGVLAAHLPLAGLGRVLVAGEDDRMTALPPAGGLAVTAVRVEAGEPVMGRDVDDRTIPQESGLVPDAVSFTKGCYLGQELVARIDSRGHVNRVLRGVVLRTNVLPPEGAVLEADGREVGRLSSPAESLSVGAPVGLALVRREVEPPGAVTVRWEGGEAPAVVEELPLVHELRSARSAPISEEP